MNATQTAMNARQRARHRQQCKRKLHYDTVAEAEAAAAEVAAKRPIPYQWYQCICGGYLVGRSKVNPLVNTPGRRDREQNTPRYQRYRECDSLVAYDTRAEAQTYADYQNSYQRQPVTVVTCRWQPHYHVTAREGSR